MNHIFRVIFDQTKRTWVAVSELVSPRGKTKSAKLVITGMALTATFVSGVASAANIEVSGGKIFAGTAPSGDGAIALNPNDDGTTASNNVGKYGIAIGQGANALTNASADKDSLNGSIAIGKNAQANRIASVVIGKDAGTDSSEAVVIGHQAKVAYNAGGAPNKGRKSVVIGYVAETTGASTVVIGAEAGTFYTIKPGSSKYVKEKTFQSVAIGFKAQVQNSDKAVVVGGESKVIGSQGVVVGQGSGAAAQALALGADVYANNNGSIAIGGDDLSGENSTYTDRMPVTTIESVFSSLWTGDNALITKATFRNKYYKNYTARQWSPTYAAKIGSIAIGTRAVAGGEAAIALGALAFAFSDKSIAIGSRAFVPEGSQQAISIGEAARVFSPKAIAVGNYSEAAGSNTSAYGYGAFAIGENSIALGQKVVAAADIYGKSTVLGAYGNNASDVTQAPNETSAVQTSLKTWFTDDSVENSHRAGQTTTQSTFGIAVEGGELLETNKGSIKKTKADGSNAFALGSHVLALKEGSIALGMWTLNNAANTINIGAYNYAADTASNSLVLGYNNRHFGGEGNVLLGLNSKITAKENNGMDTANAMVLANRSIIGSNSASATLVGDQIKVMSSSADAVAIGSSVAVGYSDDSKTTGSGTTSAVAIGKNARVDQGSNQSIAIGNDARIYTSIVDSIAIGNGASIGQGASSPDNTQGIAIGKGATVSGSARRTISFGASTVTSSNEAIAIGYQASSGSASGVALGYGSKISNAANNAIAIGKGAGTGDWSNGLESTTAQNTDGITGHNGIAIGTNTWTSKRSIALGNLAKADLRSVIGSNNSIEGRAIAIGDKAEVTALDAIGMGASANVKAKNGIAIGTDAKIENAQATEGIAIGLQSKVTAANGIAIGKGNTVSGAESIAIGKGHTVSGANSGTFGDPNTVAANNAYAFGNNNNIQSGANHTFVLGNNVTVSQAESVILGHESAVVNGNMTAGATTAYTQVTEKIGDLMFNRFAGATPVGVVSVGASTKERRIQNVAAGLISASSTDAINGSQLYRTNAILGKFATTVKGVMGSEAKVSDEGALTFTDIGATGKNTIHEAIQAVREVVEGTAGEIKVTSEDQTTGAKKYKVGLDQKIKDKIKEIEDKANQTDLEGVKTDLASAKSDLEATKTDLANAKNTLQTVETGLADTKQDLQSVKSDVQDVQNDLTTVKSDVADVKNNVTNLTNEVATKANASDLNTLKSNTLKLTGDASSATDAQQLDKSGGLSFAIVGDGDNLVTSATGSTVTVGLSETLKEKLKNFSSNSADATAFKNLVDSLGGTVDDKTKAISYGNTYANVTGSDSKTAPTTPKEAINQLISAVNKGLTFAATAGDSITRHLGDMLKIIEGDVETGYVGKNLKTGTNTTDGAILIGLTEKPEFEALKLKAKKASETDPETPTVTFTPDADGNLNLAKTPATGTTDPADNKVVLGGLKDGEAADTAVTKGALDALKTSAGLNGANGIDGASEAGAAPVVGQRGVVGTDVTNTTTGETLAGPAGKDGLNGTTLANKVQALRDGAAGPMVYTDENGNRLLVENGKYYQPDLVGNKVKANDGKWYDPAQVDANGNPIAQADGTMPEGKTLAQLAENNTDKIVEADKVQLTAVNPDGSTAEPTALGNLKSALGLPTDSSANFVDPDKAKEVTKELLDKTGNALGSAVTLADLQAVAQAGLDFQGNQADDEQNIVHRPLGTKLKIEGKSGLQYTEDNKGNYSADNLITHKDGEDTIRIEMLKVPTFEAFKLQAAKADANDTDKPTITFTPDDKGNLTLSKDPATGDNASDNKVVLGGLKDGDAADTAVTKGALDALKTSAGLNGANGIDGASEAGAAPVVGQRGVPSKNTNEATNGQPTVGASSLTGPAGKDGLNGTTLANKVQALRDGAAGPMVYTDKDGNRLLVENGKYYQPELVGDKVKANDGKWYDADKVDAHGNPIVQADGTMPDGKTLAELAAEPAGADKVVDPADVRMTAVNPDGSTANPTVLGNLKSALGALDSGATEAEQVKDAQDKATKLLSGTDKDGQPLDPNQAVTVADLQVLAQAGIDVLGNQADQATNRIHVPLGGLLNIKGSDVVYGVDNASSYSTDNLIAYRDEKGVLRIAFLTQPEFEALKLQAKKANESDPDMPTVTFTPDADGNLNLAKTPTTNAADPSAPADDKVVLGGLKDGEAADTAVTKGALDALKTSAGLNGANGIDGASEAGAAPVVGQRGVVGTDVRTSTGEILTGSAGKDGLNGTTLANKVQALRDGAAGPMVYTDENGNRLLVENGKYYKPELVGDKVKANDGKWYEPAQVDDNGNPKTGATGQTLADLAKTDAGADKVVAAENVRLSAVNPDGSTKSPTALGNLADGKIAENSSDAVTGNQLHQLMNATGAELDKDGNIVAPTIHALTNADGSEADAPQSVAAGVNAAIDKLNEGLTFSDGDNSGKQQLGSSITLKSGDIAGDNTVSGDNLAVKYVKDDKTGNGTWTVAMKKTPTFETLTVGNKDGESLVLNGTQIQGKDADGQTSRISLGKDSVSLAGADGSSPVKLSGIAAGENANDAVNKQQLDDAVTTMNNNLSDVLGASFAKDPDTGALTITNHNPKIGAGIGGTGKTTITEAIAAAKVQVVAGSNIEVAESSDENTGATVYTVSTAKNLTVESITVTRTMGTDEEGNPETKSVEMTINDDGNLDMGNVRVTGVSEGVIDTDLVTLGQVRGMIGDINSRLADVAKGADAGTASALAAANLPTAYEAGRNMVAVAGGSYRGQNAIAIGFSSISDTGKTMIRASGTATSRGDYGVGVGIGYQW